LSPILLIGDFNARIAEDDEFITLDENILFETFDGFIENAPNVLQQLNLPLKRNNVDFMLSMSSRAFNGCQLLIFCKFLKL
jgi:hypothetical protein